MAWIKTIRPEDAAGGLKQEACRRQKGKSE